MCFMATQIYRAQTYTDTHMYLINVDLAKQLNQSKYKQKDLIK